MTKDGSFGYSTTPTVLPTSTARRYLVPTALGASSRCISAVAVVVVVVAGAVKGAAAAIGLGVAAPAAAAAAFFLAVLLGGPDELEGVSSYWVITAGGGADLLLRGGIGSIPREAFLAAALWLLLEQESEVFTFGLGLVVF